MKVNDYRVQSILTMDEFPNYPLDNSVIKNRVYFTISNIDINEILNKGINHITAYNYKPALKDNSFLITVDLNKINRFTHLTGSISGIICFYNIDFIPPEAIIFIDFVFVNNPDRELRLSLGELSNYIKNELLENGDKGLIKFLRSLKKEEDNFIYIDFYELLDILVIYDIIDRKICDSFI